MFKHEFNIENILTEENIEDDVTVEKTSECIADNEELIINDNVCLVLYLYWLHVSNKLSWLS